MAIELSNIMFTDQDDIVPSSGAEEIVNHGIANTLDGNDLITGTGTTFGFDNRATLNTDDGNDTITGLGEVGIINQGTINTGNDNDSLICRNRFYNSGVIFLGEGNDFISAENNEDFYFFYPALYNDLGIIDTGNGNDTITGTGVNIISNIDGTINTGNGEDSIICQGRFFNSGNVFLGEGNDSISARFTGPSSAIDHYLGIIDTGNGNDTITGAGNYYGISNMNGIINTGNGEDSIICRGEFFNSGNVFLGDGNDSILADTDVLGYTLRNYNFIGTGDGNDTITNTSTISNQGVIETGDGDDSIIVDAGADGTGTTYGIDNVGVINMGHGNDSIIVDGGIDDLTGTSYGIYNYGGAINMGDGNDSIIANEGFKSAENSSGAWFLGEGDDYIKGYGSGDFYGGNGNDTLELTPGTYTVGIWGEGGESPIFTKGDQLMITSEFEKLKAGSTIYDFTSLTASQIIVVT